MSGGSSSGKYKSARPASAKAASIKVVSENKKAHFDFEIEDTYEAGVALMGSEVKAIRAGQVNLKDSYVVIKNGEAYLQKAHISPYKPSSVFGHEPERLRKLLLNRNEIDQIERAMAEKGYTCVPTKVYLKNGRIKLEIGLARGRKGADKREVIKDRESKRELSRAMRSSRK